MMDGDTRVHVHANPVANDFTYEHAAAVCKKLRTIFWPALGRRLGLANQVDCTLDSDVLLHAPYTAPPMHSPSDF